MSILVAVAVSLVSARCEAQLVALTGARIETLGDDGGIDNGTILIAGGKIKAVGSDVEIPATARVIDAADKVVIPGIVDPYYVVPISRNAQTTATRTVVFRGRTFVVGGGSPAIATTFAKVADGVDMQSIEWDNAVRSGITTAHLVASGYAQSSLAGLKADVDGSQRFQSDDPNGVLLVSATNSTPSLKILKDGLSEPKTGGQAGGQRTRPEPGAGNTPRRGPPSGGRGRPNASAGPRASRSSTPSPTDSLWKAVRAGDRPVFVNLNNASAILHVLDIAEPASKSKLAVVASGPNVFLNIDNFDEARTTIVLQPRIDEKPNTRLRINLPAMLEEHGIDFVFSLSLGQSGFRQMQHNPLFSVGMLIRAGLDRQDALHALTLGPAKLIGKADDIGSIEVGKDANLVLFDADPFAATSTIVQVFVQGKVVYEN